MAMKSERLNKAPLALTLAQVRFSSVVHMVKYVPEIQEKLRKLGFPLFTEEQVHSFMVGPSLGVPQSPRPTYRWTFLAAEKRESIVLTESFLVVETANYDVFPTFLQRIKTALETVHGFAELQVIQQIGLRYVNVIRSESNVLAINYLSDSLHGIRVDSIEGLNNVANYHRSQGKTSHGEMIIQIAGACGEGILPPDLADTKVEVLVKPKHDELFVVLDLDHISKTQFPFDLTKLERMLDGMHDSIEMAFRSIVTKDAIKIWK